jgi:hypothetical protein
MTLSGHLRSPTGPNPIKCRSPAFTTLEHPPTVALFIHEPRGRPIKVGTLVLSSSIHLLLILSTPLSPYLRFAVSTPLRNFSFGSQLSHWRSAPGCQLIASADHPPCALALRTAGVGTSTRQCRIHPRYLNDVGRHRDHSPNQR